MNDIVITIKHFKRNNLFLNFNHFRILNLHIRIIARNRLMKGFHSQFLYLFGIFRSIALVFIQRKFESFCINCSGS